MVYLLVIKYQVINIFHSAIGTGNPDFQLEETHSFSILHGTGGREALDLVAGSEDERNLWVNGLNHLIECVRSLHQDRQYDL